jgi:hypothetical protein
MMAGRTERLKTGAEVSEKQPILRLAEFFALPVRGFGIGLC